MAVKFLHTGDWHIGRRFAERGERARPFLQRARLELISHLAKAGRERGIRHALVAGDVFDSMTTADTEVRAALGKLRAEADMNWHLLPGNHDAGIAGGVWDRLLRMSVPSNVRVHRDVAPFAIDSTCAVLPAPLLTRHVSQDPTRYFDSLTTGSGVMRVGLAHGSVQNFGADTGAVANLIASDRARLAGLEYLALGDWHGTRQINERTWYAGTPEYDRSVDNDQGNALAVTLEGVGALPHVERVQTTHYIWKRLKFDVTSVKDLDALTAVVQGFGAAASRHVLDVEIGGTLTSDARLELDERLEEVAVDVLDLDVDLKSLHLIADEVNFELSPRLLALAHALKTQRTGAANDAEREIVDTALARLQTLARGRSVPERSAR